MPTSAAGSSGAGPGGQGRSVPGPGARGPGAPAAGDFVAQRRAAPAARRRGFTLIELLVVLLIVALGTGLVTLALRDADASRLEEEGARLAALLEMARAEARVTGAPVRWVPLGAEEAAAAGAGAAGAAPPVQFRFVGLHPGRTWPTRWLQPGVVAQVPGAAFVVLGPEPILPPQRVVLRLNDRLLELSSDGLGPFAVAAAGTAANR